MSFWLDDDDDYQASQSSNPLASQSTAVYSSQQLSQFACGVCGGNETYNDPVSGSTVCVVCYTEVNNTQETEAEVEDALFVGARAFGGAFRTVREGRKRKRELLPLDDVNSAVPLPSVSECLEGVRFLLKRCVACIVDEILPEDPFVKTDMTSNERVTMKEQLDEAVGALWLGYLRAWSDGAEHYGKYYPSIRFCFRDYFLSHNVHDLLVSKVLVHKAQQKVAAQASTAPPTATDGVDAEIEEHEKEQLLHMSEQQGFDDDLADPDTTDRNLGLPKNLTQEYVPKRYLAIKNMLDQNLKGRKHMGYREAALSLQPSMTLLATVLWMALQQSGIAIVTAWEVCQWVRTGQIPLVNAYRVGLSDDLQKKLKPVSGFFLIKHRYIMPDQLEAAAYKLVVAARVKRSCAPAGYGPGPSKKFCIQFAWNKDTLPIVIAKLVANAGLSEGVMDRTLALAGLNSSIPKRKKVYGRRLPEDIFPIPTPPALVAPQNLTSVAELLALIAIAVQLDRYWRMLEFHGEKPVVPINEDECGCDPLVALDHAAKHLFPNKDNSRLPQGWGEDASQLKLSSSSSFVGTQERSRSTGQQAPPRERHRLVAGRAPVPRPRELQTGFLPLHALYSEADQRPSKSWVSHDFHQDRLVQYLAYTAGVRIVGDIYIAMDRFLHLRDDTYHAIQRRKANKDAYREQLKAKAGEL